MRRAVVLSILIFVSVLIPILGQQKPAATGSIEGIVVRADNGAPIAGAIVTYIGGPAPEPAPAAPAPPVGRGTVQEMAALIPIHPTVTTGPDGKFSFKNLAAGGYQLAASADGFVGQQYGQKVMNGQGVRIFLKDGQAVKDATFRLPQPAIITGKITDEQGLPATGAEVQLIHREYAPLATLLQATSGMTTVDDRGEYRIFGVMPGRYFLVAGTPPASVRGVGVSRTSLYSVVYYPSSPDLEQSTQVELKPGTELKADIRVRRLDQTYRVRGRIVAPGGTLSSSVSFMILARWLSQTGSTRGRVLDRATGAFEFDNLLPGEYTVVAEDSTGGPAAQATVRVIDKDVSDVVLTLLPGATAPGHVIVEGQALSVPGVLDRFRLTFTGTITTTGQRGINVPTPVTSRPTADGRFEVTGLRDGDFRVLASIGVPGFYIKSVNYGGTEILGTRFRKFSASDAATITVIIRQGAAQINGTVTDRKSQPASGVQVFLIPVNHDRMDLPRMYYADQNGRFTFTNIEPGDYKIFSWEAVARGEPYDPDFMRIYEPQVPVTHVAEGSNQTVSVRMFPAP